MWPGERVSSARDAPAREHATPDLGWRSARPMMDFDRRPAVVLLSRTRGHAFASRSGQNGAAARSGVAQPRRRGSKKEKPHPAADRVFGVKPPRGLESGAAGSSLNPRAGEAGTQQRGAATMPGGSNDKKPHPEGVRFLVVKSHPGDSNP